MHRRKMATNRAHLPSLARAGIWYVSMIWLVRSRAHPKAEQALESVSRAAVVRRRFQDHGVVFAHRREVGTERCEDGARLLRTPVWRRVGTLCSDMFAQAQRTRLVRQLAEGFAV